jgi:tight adherence protein B
MIHLIAWLIFFSVALGLLWAFRVRGAGGGARAGPGGPADLVEPGADGSPVHTADPAAPAKPGYFELWEATARLGGLTWNRSTYYAAAGAGLFLAVALALTDHINGAFVAAAAGLAGPHFYVRHLAEKRRDQFTRQLPQALQLAATVLRSGGALLQAVEAVSTDLPAPMGEEFRLILARMRLQVPAHEAMAEVQARMGVREFAAVVVTTRITAEVGGNLAHLYDQAARSIVEAENAQRSLRALTTEGRMSANLVAALPFAVMALMHFVSPGYFSVLFETWAGRGVFLLCSGAIWFGWMTVRRMVDIRVY